MNIVNGKFYFSFSEKIGKTITKSATIAPKTHDNRVQKDDHEIDDTDFIKTKKVKKYAASLSKWSSVHNIRKISTQNVAFKR